MKTQAPPKSIYKMEGEFLGFIPKPGGKLKYIQVQVGERIIPIKLAKELRETLGQELVEGDRLSIFLESKGSGHISKLKLKSDRIEKLSSTSEPATESNSDSFSISPSLPSSVSSPKTKQGKILVCRKSSCSKRGGKQLYSALIETLKQLNLQDRVSIELTGCQKQCKKAPSLILMPGKVKHAYVHPHNLALLLKAHYL
ncbi:MAG: (2Fe-2S) ferredoxin domain-containing protein [Cyanobacteria bacterium P01_G01_bin.19]